MAVDNTDIFSAATIRFAHQLPSPAPSFIQELIDRVVTQPVD